MSQPIITCTVTNDLSGDQRMHRICSSLVKEGYQVTLVGRVCSNSKAIPKHWTFNTYRLKCWFNQGKLFYLEFNIRLFFFLLYRNCSIQVAIDTDTLLANYLSVKVKGRKLVFDAHEYYSEVPELVGRKISKGAWGLLEKILIPRLKYAYTVNNSLAKIFKEKYKVDFKVIRNLPFLSDDRQRQESRTIVYQGALNKGRGLKELIKVMPSIDACLEIIGIGDEEQELKQLVAKNGLNHKVVFHGFMDAEALKQKTRSASIGVNLLENLGLSYYYSLANKFCDYIEAEVPQISMAFPEYTALNKRYGVAVLLRDLEEKPLRYAINKLLDDQDFYHQLKNNCRKARKELCWEKEEKILLEFYKNVVNNK